MCSFGKSGDMSVYSNNVAVVLRLLGLNLKANPIQYRFGTFESGKIHDENLCLARIFGGLFLCKGAGGGGGSVVLTLVWPFSPLIKPTQHTNKIYRKKLRSPIWLRGGLF